MTGKVLPEHTGKESEDELGHQDVWELIVPGLGILFLDSEGELRCTGSFMRIYCLTSAFEENSLEKVALKIKQELIEAELLYGSR